MKTFEAGGDVRPIDEILDGTLHVKALRAELGGLLDEAQVMRNILEESNKMLVAAMEQSRKDAYKLQEQSAIITDLRAKLDAANAELHELRIRAGLEAWGRDVLLYLEEDENTEAIRLKTFAPLNQPTIPTR